MQTNDMTFEQHLEYIKEVLIPNYVKSRPLLNSEQLKERERFEDFINEIF